MCKKAILYQAGDNKYVTFKSRGSRKKYNFQQICYSTECVRALANIKEVPMYEVLMQVQTNAKASRYLYSEVIGDVRRPAKEVALGLKERIE